MRKNISSLRKEIDKIDEKIFILLKKRFKISKKIGRIKNKNKILIQDRNREKEILNKGNKEFKLRKEFVKRIYNLIFKESRRVQRWIKMARRNKMIETWED